MTLGQILDTIITTSIIVFLTFFFQDLSELIAKASIDVNKYNSMYELYE